MNEDKFFSESDLVNNPFTRVAVCLCLDISASMYGEPVSELNKGLRMFYDAINEDPIAQNATEVAVVSFGSIATCERDFASIKGDSNPPRLKASGRTLMGEAVNMSLDLVEKRKDTYKDNGINYYQPWLVLMTDGENNGEDKVFQKAIVRCNSLVKDGKLTVFPVAIGSDANKEQLKKFSPKLPPLQLNNMKFKEFFTWLSQSVKSTSASNPGEKINLPPVDAWANISG